MRVVGPSYDLFVSLDGDLARLKRQAFDQISQRAELGELMLLAIDGDDGHGRRVQSKRKGITCGGVSFSSEGRAESDP